MSEKTYLGDSVYAEIESGMVKLTTEDGYESSNTIYLELSVLNALNDYVERIKTRYSEAKESTP